jgi:hypothetical protein
MKKFAVKLRVGFLDENNAQAKFAETVVIIEAETADQALTFAETVYSGADLYEVIE